MSWLGDADWETLVGTFKRRTAGAPELAATAFDSERAVDDLARRKAWLDLRALLVGEGAYTPAGAAAFGPLLAHAERGTASPVRLWTLLLDLLWGPASISARGLQPAAAKKGPGAEILAAARASLGRIEALLNHPDPATRSGASLALGALRAPSQALAQASSEERDDAARAAMLLALAGAPPHRARRGSLGRAWSRRHRPWSASRRPPPASSWRVPRPPTWRETPLPPSETCAATPSRCQPPWGGSHSARPSASRGRGCC